MKERSARVAARVLGAAVTAGAEFVSPSAFVKRLRTASPPTASVAPVPPPAHLVVHFIENDIAAPLMLGAAERDAGVRGTYLIPTRDSENHPDAADHRRMAVVAYALGRMGHLTGGWVPQELLADRDQAAASLGALFAVLRAEGVDTIDAVGISGEQPDLGFKPPTAGVGTSDTGSDFSGELGTDERVLANLCEDVGAPCWIAGASCGAEELVRPLFHTQDASSGWTLDCTAPAYRMASVDAGRLSIDFLPLVSDAAARGSCLYTLTPDLYR